MNLFDLQKERQKGEAPLSHRMRPGKLEDFIGQEHIVGKNTLLYRSIVSDKLSSLILYGPPGTGKTTLAMIIANTTKSNFVQLNATTSGVKDIKAMIEDAKYTLEITGKRTILFIDEIHRFNKTQQDVLLPYVEDGTIIMIGATTENPYYEVNKALISRSIVFQLKHLTRENILVLLKKTVSDRENGFGALNIEITDEALVTIADLASGDARFAFNALELAVKSNPLTSDGIVKIDKQTVEDCTQKRVVNYDKTGDNHYDTISAFIKSMRGSDPDAALYYMARMIYAGEDPKFIARRIVICASEDVGNADPHALLVAVAAMQATEFIGLPECQFSLAQAVTYIACAPKSNSLGGYYKALRDVQEVQISGVPVHLRGSHFKGVNEGEDYKYAHEYPGHYVEQQYLPDELVGRTYYHPSENGVEKKIKESLKRLKPDKY